MTMRPHFFRKGQVKKNDIKLIDKFWLRPVCLMLPWRFWCFLSTFDQNCCHKASRRFSPHSYERIEVPQSHSSVAAISEWEKIHQISAGGAVSQQKLKPKKKGGIKMHIHAMMLVPLGYFMLFLGAFKTRLVRPSLWQDGGGGAPHDGRTVADVGQVQLPHLWGSWRPSHGPGPGSGLFFVQKADHFWGVESIQYWRLLWLHAAL